MQSEELKDFFEIDQIAEYIVDNKWKNVALQFPDKWLHFSAKVVEFVYKQLENIMKVRNNDHQDSIDEYE